MLFRTVYGPELIAVYNYLAQADTAVHRQTLYDMLLPSYADAKLPSTQNIDDALAFLLATSLIHEDGQFYGISIANSIPINLLILHQLSRLAKHEIEARHELDPLYFLLLEEVFIKPDRLFVDKMHIEVNKLNLVREAGGLSQEKIQAWKRVMTFLGVGQRVGGGFQCAYTPSLLRAVFDIWDEKSGSLQSFFETHLATFLPFETEAKGVAKAVSEPLWHLARRGELLLESRQDSSSRAYFGEQRFQYLTYSGGMT